MAKHKIVLTTYRCDDEAHIRIRQHKSFRSADDWIRYFAFPAAKGYNPSYFYDEPVEEYEGVWFFNDTDYYEIHEFEVEVMDHIDELSHYKGLVARLEAELTQLSGGKDIGQ